MSAPMLAHIMQATTVGCSREARPVQPVSRLRQVKTKLVRRRQPGTRLLTFERVAAPHQPSAVSLDFQRGFGLARWLSTLLSQKHTFEVDIIVLSLILHALWKKAEHRQRLLNDVKYRKEAFNAFLVDVIKAYQARDNIDETFPKDTPNKDIWEEVEKLDGKIMMRSAASGGLPKPSGELLKASDELAELSDELPEPAMDDSSDEDWPAANKATAAQKQKTPLTRFRRRHKVLPVRKGQQSGSPKLKGRPSAPNGTTAAAARSGDVCGLVQDMIRTSGRKHRDLAVYRKQIEKDEDDSGLPDSSFLFIRCVRCPEIVFTDYRAIREHWEARCHFLSCIMCDNIVSSSRMALAHLRLEHKEPVPDGWFRLVRCHPCRQSGFYSTEQVISHMAGHRAERARNPTLFPPFLACFKFIRCNQCGMKQVNHRTELEDHYKRDPPPLCQHDPARPPPVPCPVCRRMWAGAAALAAHMRHRRGRCFEGSYANRRPDQKLCPVCHRRMNPGETIADHLMTHQAPGLRCVECSFVAASHEEMKVHWTFTWRCDCAACDTHVGRGSRLLQHVVEDHDGGKQLNATKRARPKRNPDPDPGICPICGEYRLRVKEHIVRSHATRFCSCCNKMLRMGTWRDHQRHRKTPDKLRCKVCHKILSSGYALKGHMRLHTGEKPFQCELCDFAYPQKCQLKAHMKSAHGIIWPSGGGAAGTTPS